MYLYNLLFYTTIGTESTNLVIFQHGKLDLLLLVLDFLGSGVILLLALLGSAPESQHKMEGAFLLDVVVGEGAPVLKLFAGEDQPLLIGRDPFFVLDLGFHILDGVRWLDL